MALAKRHWFDPIARELLRATGQLPLKKHEDQNQIKEAGLENELATLNQKVTRNRSSIAREVDVICAAASDWRQLPACTDDMIELLLKLQKVACN